jgi:hypothetical protein
MQTSAALFVLATMVGAVIVSIVASIIDVRFTLLLILSGHGDEINPLMRWAVRLGPFTAYSLALIQTLTAGAIACILIHEYGAIGWALLWLLVAVRVGSAAWNWNIWRKG